MKKYFIKLLSFILVVVSIMSTSILSFAETDNEIDDFLSSIPQRESSEIGILEFTPDENEEGVLATSIPKQIFLNSGTFAKSKEETVEYIVENEAKNKKEKYSITIAVKQPNPGSYDCAKFEYDNSKTNHVVSYDIGHTFVVLGDHSKEKNLFYSYGLYPSNPISYTDVYHNKMVDGGIFNDTGHEYTVRKTYWVDYSTYKKALKFISKATVSFVNKKAKYSIVDYNCTTFAKDVMAHVGLNTGISNHNWVIPKSIKDRYNNWIAKQIIDKLEKNFGCYPGAAGEQLEK